ncbi:MAG: 4Fe-4S ferredoxin [Deltaproteobacteria bacterium HGW-Deltaproteobacteria-15]|jgi:formate hydrogenlyase subunit 6/NADH:ubiquinone oxidoreductase subunit I|nr:MAG: 4Fe-4S ferredoxin [Deltaproteobacteria bacterium HGW-Deltaproteobacteria-15]
MSNVYERLRERLDDLSTGYPATQSGVEIRILKKLFTEEEAELFLKLSPLPEPPAQVAERLGSDASQTAALMEKMAAKGLLFRLRKGETVRYGAVPFLVGILEHQVKRIYPEIAMEFDEYFESGFGKTLQSFKTPLMRSIPINRQVALNWPIAPYEDALEIIDQQEVIALAPCICRTWKKTLGEGCDRPLETCLLFGHYGHYYVENHMGRYISKEEARVIVKRNDEAGLVMQPFNSQKVGGMCSCCGDCCGMLRSLKKQPSPARAVQSNYFAEVNSSECSGCETCVDRCQMDAIQVVEEKAVVNLERCIGCGLCVTTCTTEAMQLKRKPENQIYQPPQSGAETYMRIAMERGKNLMPK